MAASPALHARSVSDESTSFASSPSRLIIEHILSYPGTYELPLRTMYALNSAPRAQSLPRAPGAQKSPPTSTSDAAHKLTCSLMAELSQLSTQPTSLPPSFVSSFLRKCFTSDLRKVDFNQALTGLDYLKDLDNRRSRELKAALQRLELTPQDAATAEDTLAERYPLALDWYRSLESRVHKVEALYSQLYIALRRWILINEMSLAPFSKASCVAMLNTVYPPVISPKQNLPTPQLTASVIKAQRDGFFRYIQAVERSGSSILNPIIQQGRTPGEETGWPAVRNVLDRYLQAATSMIDECMQIMSINDAPSPTGSVFEERVGRKADSGISFLQSRKSSTSSGISSDRPPSRQQYKQASALEKLAREIKNIRRTKTDIEEMVSPVDDMQTTTAGQASNAFKEDPKKVRKMKSLSSLNLRRTPSRSGLRPSSPNDIPAFDAGEMNKARQTFMTNNMIVAN